MTGIAATLTWPVGVTWTAWHYLWRILPVWRSEVPGTRAEDEPPPIPAGVETEGLQQPVDGSGPLFHRLYSGAVAAPGTPAVKLIARLSSDPNVVAPSRLARFKKTRGVDGAMHVGDEFVVRMPGPWDGPIRVLETTSNSFRFGTLDGHLEAGQIEWRTWEEQFELHFAGVTWSLVLDKASASLRDFHRMANEV